MIFQIFDEKGKAIMRTNHISCIPPDYHLASMVSIGYKFKINGKPVSRKKINEIRDEK